MTIQHLTPSDYITTKWSGGLTTQLGIAPASAVYADRDFLWRLSSATVEDAESDFTALPDYERLISTLEGTPGAAAATSTSCSARASARAGCAASTLRRSSTRPSTAARA